MNEREVLPSASRHLRMQWAACGGIAAGGGSGQRSSTSDRMAWAADEGRKAGGEAAVTGWRGWRGRLTKGQPRVARRR